MPGVRNLPRQFHGLRLPQILSVNAGVVPARLSPGIEVLQLDAKHSRLNLIEAEIAAKQLVVILRPEAMTAQQPDFIGKFRIVRGDHAAVAEPAEIFGRVKADAAEIADRSGALSV